MVTKIIKFILYLRRKLFEIPTTSIEVFSALCAILFSLVYMIKGYMLKQFVSYEHFEYFSVPFALLIIAISIMHLAVMNNHDISYKLVRVISCRILGLFWFIIAATFTINGLNTAFFTYTLLGIFVILASWELGESVNKERIFNINRNKKYNETRDV